MKSQDRWPVELPASLAEQVKRIASELGTSPEDLIAWAVERQLSKELPPDLDIQGPVKKE